MNVIYWLWDWAKYLLGYGTNSSTSTNPPTPENIWANIKEEPQFSDKVNILKIQYDPQQKYLLNLFRGALLSKEISLRIYYLTSEVINMSPGTYEAWVLRRKCIDEVKEINLDEELKWLDWMNVEVPKNYQIWHHRKLLIDKLNDCSHEKEVMQKILDGDQKNFHCWSHRIWMIRRFNNTEGEFDFIEKMLSNDVKNNSVWNYRYFLVEYLNMNNNEKDEIIKKEIKYALDKIKLCIYNESPFSYINGWIRKNKEKYSNYQEIKEVMNDLYQENIQNNNLQFVLGMLLDIYEEEKNEENFNEIIDLLIKEDYIRKKYYLWRKKLFQK